MTDARRSLGLGPTPPGDAPATPAARGYQFEVDDDLVSTAERAAIQVQPQIVASAPPVALSPVLTPVANPPVAHQPVAQPPSAQPPVAFFGYQIQGPPAAAASPPVRPIAVRPLKRHPFRRWIVLLIVVMALALGSLAGYGQLLSRQSQPAGTGAATLPEDFFSEASPGLAEALPPQGYLPDPAAACVQATLSPISTGKGLLTGQVRGLDSGQELWSRSASKPQIPASSEKLLTSLALVDALGAGALATTFTTAVVAGEGDRIILVGGGDPYLASSAKAAELRQSTTLDDLAAATAEALKAQGKARVSLAFDGSLFTGPAWNSTWHPSYSQETVHVSALIVDMGYARAKGSSLVHVRAPSTNPGLDAVQIFANQLTRHGITVTAVAGRGLTAPAQATIIASIESLPLRDIIAQALEVSDNTASEMLLRQAAIAAGLPGSSQNGSQVVMDWLKRIGVSTPGLRVADGSGLSRSNAISAFALSGAVAWAGATSGPPREVLTLMAVANVSGTLADRFQAQVARSGRGWVHAKTGSLPDVASLTGYTVTAAGQVVAFSFIINGGNQEQYPMRATIDQLVSALTTMNC